MLLFFIYRHTKTRNVKKELSPDTSGVVMTWHSFRKLFHCCESTSVLKVKELLVYCHVK